MLDERIARLAHERIEANRDDPGFKLTISAPTNADTREIGAAIREERRKAGELGADVRTLKATDRGGHTYDLPLAIGDKVRVFDRVYDATAPTPVPTPGKGETRRCLANNGEIVEVCDLTAEGLVVRNQRGDDGLIAWRKIQSRPGAPVRLSV